MNPICMASLNSPESIHSLHFDFRIIQRCINFNQNLRCSCYFFKLWRSTQTSLLVEGAHCMTHFQGLHFILRCLGLEVLARTTRPFGRGPITVQASGSLKFKSATGWNPNATTIVLLVPEMYVCNILFQQIIGSRVFQNVYRSKSIPRCLLMLENDLSLNPIVPCHCYCSSGSRKNGCKVFFHKKK